MSVIIKIENVSKQYRLGLIGTNTLKGDIQRWWSRLRGLPDPTIIVGQNMTDGKASSEYVWALKDINLEIGQGTILGIIGKNGAGKSTLLKLLSRVTAPTKGTIKVKGRIASLLEVGTGFHPELTGRENIFLNGAILGMTKKEIQNKLDEIVDFAGVSMYLDTPVKRYSSGMYVRLAFAVAAHLEPEILIVDEVLAVGDSDFQKRAIGKMQSVSKNDGRTVLFVSHNMASISSLTTNSICLVNGNLECIGKTNDVIKHYLNNSMGYGSIYISEPKIDRPSFIKIEIKTSEPKFVHKNGEDLIIQFTINMPCDLNGMAVSFQIFSENEIPVIYGYIFDTQNEILRVAGNHKLTSIIKNCRLYEGKYYVKAHLAESKGKTKFEEIDRICQFEVVMLDEIIEWGWQKNVCLYMEDICWEY